MTDGISLANGASPFARRDNSMDTIVPRAADQTFNDEFAIKFVVDLFKFVLGRKRVEPSEVEYWVQQVVRNQDPAKVLRLFGTSEEYRRRQERLSRSELLFPADHFYSPIVNLHEVETDANRIFGDHDLSALDLNLDLQRKTFERLALHSKSLPFSRAADGMHRYWYDNTSYGYGDAFVYWGLLTEFLPRRIVEIGSGFTSALTLDAIDFHKLETRCTFIDPFPELLKKVGAPIADNHTIIEDRVQNVSPDVVDNLEENDILFIDSSHVVKTGSDVHFELFELLPRLKKGVVVHFHDIFYPFEYPREWVLGQLKSWNEQYFLRAFLMYNTSFEIFFFNHCFATLCSDAYRALPSDIGGQLRLNPGGGLWLRRR
jgi:hypothetical protein